MTSASLLISGYKSLIRVFLVLLLGLKFTYCAARKDLPFEQGELLEHPTSVVRLAVSENIPPFRKGPYCTNFHIELIQEKGKSMSIGIIQTKLYLEDIPDKYLRIAFITITPEYRGQGIGSTAMRILIS